MADTRGLIANDSPSERQTRVEAGPDKHAFSSSGIHTCSLSEMNQIRSGNGPLPSCFVDGSKLLDDKSKESSAAVNAPGSVGVVGDARTGASTSTPGSKDESNPAATAKNPGKAGHSGDGSNGASPPGLRPTETGGSDVIQHGDTPPPAKPAGRPAPSGDPHAGQPSDSPHPDKDPKPAGFKFDIGGAGCKLTIKQGANGPQIDVTVPKKGHHNSGVCTGSVQMQ